jgi:hypothetical protein
MTIRTSDETEEFPMGRTDVADVRDTAKDAMKDTASSAIDTVRTKGTAVGESLAAAASAALEAAAEESRRRQKKAQKRARALADEAAKAARQSAKSARKRADKATAKASKKARKRAHELNVTIQEKAGRKPRKRGRGVVVVGGLALAGVAAATVLNRKKSEQKPPSPADTGSSGLPGDQPPAA